MTNRLVRLACALFVVSLSSQGCLYKKRTGTGTNIGTGLGEDQDELPPPGVPAARPDDE